MSDPYTFLGCPVTEELAARIADNLVLRDERTGQHVTRQRTERFVALRCACHHHERQHGTDRRGRPICHGSAQCACGEYRPETQETQETQA